MRITIKAHRIAGYAHGQEVKVEADAEGIPLDHFWVRRLRDAERDSCCEVVVARRAPRRKAATTSKPVQSDGDEESS